MKPHTRNASTSMPCKLQSVSEELRQHPYRVFISYSHQDRELAQKLTNHLKEKGLCPITDHEIRVGEAFSDEIRDMIECSHVFMPLVTKSANERLWVQQEIGYATALHVPVCPIAVVDLPSGMASQIQGIHVIGDGRNPPTVGEVMQVVADRLSYTTIDDLVRRARHKTRQGRYDCALYWTERQELLANLTDAAFRSGSRLRMQLGVRQTCVDQSAWRMRQATAFTSFSIPDAKVTSEKWTQRDPERYRSFHDRRLLRRERQVMQAYAQRFGCDLIMDPRGVVKEVAAGRLRHAGPAAKAEIPKHDPPGMRLRLQLMIQFIQSHLDDDNIRVIIPRDHEQITTNLQIVGDWYAAEAVVPHYQNSGYERTVFTRHAPTVLNTIDRFDQDFRDFLAEKGFDPLRDRNAVRNAKKDALMILRESLAKATAGIPRGSASSNSHPSHDSHGRPTSSGRR